MTSNQVHIWSAIAQACNALTAILSSVGIIPHVKPETFIFVMGIIAAVGHYATQVTTPNTNSDTPDQLPTVTITKTVTPAVIPPAIPTSTTVTK